MTSARDLHLSNFIHEIIQIVILTRPLKLSILFNHAEHLKRLVPFVIRTTPFYNFKISISNGSANLFREMILVQGQEWPAQKSQAFKTSTNRSNNRNHKNPLKSNKPGPSKAPEALTRPFKTPEAPTRLFEAPLPVFLTLDVARYTQKDMYHLLQTFFQVLKGGSGDKLKVKTPDVYCGRSHMKYYNFCQ